MAYTWDDNGNRKRTVRCSYCGETGHSRRTCSYLHPNGTPAQQRAKRRAAAKEQRKLAREQQKIDKAAGREIAKTPRNCGYCGEQGHSRRHCEQLAADQAKLVDITLDYRRGLVDEIVSRGIGKGALLATKMYVWDNRTGKHATRMQYATITGADIEGLAPYSNWAISKRDRHNYGQISVLTLLNLTGHRNETRHVMGQLTREPLPKTDNDASSFTAEAYDKYQQRTGREADVVVPGEVSIPDGFLDPDKVAAEVKEYFSNTTKSREHYNILDRVKYNDTYGNQ